MGRKILIGAVVALLVIGAVSFYAQNTASSSRPPLVAAVLSSTQIDAILTLLASFRTDSSTLNKVKVAFEESARTAPPARPNLSISSLKLLQPAISAPTVGNIPEQHLTAVVGVEHSTSSLVGTELRYRVNVYEVHYVKKTRFKSVTGLFSFPAAGKESIIEVDIPGGLPYDHDNDVRSYVAEVKIDDSNKAKESNERDNIGWSKEWQTAYTLGQ